jgi:hypothetical protein
MWQNINEVSATSLGDLFACYAPQVHPCRLVATIPGGKNPLAKNPLWMPLLHLQIFCGDSSKQFQKPY